eukprot:TRINITY_DN29968_c0_g1_i1.p1 TRINITY_DN29968_c0_g1~~TRINITY_DN29968_c0_g1_i1.p1  ORF type:complete len:500 (+),score=90.77 TRINITY_DN29968_c0_g1_i1:130-1629(+)
MKRTLVRCCVPGLPVAYQNRQPISKRYATRREYDRQEKETRGTDLLRKLPALADHLSGEERLFVNVPRPLPGSTELSQVGNKANLLRRAQRKIAEEAERGDDASADDAAAAPEPEPSSPDGGEQHERTLKQVLLRASLCSSARLQLITGGSVKVNAVVVTDPRFKVRPSDVIWAKDRRVVIDYPRVWRYRKPLDAPGLSQALVAGDTPDAWRRFLPPRPIHINPLQIRFCGGIELFTNDSGLKIYLEGGADVEQEYEVTVFGDVSQELLRALNAGVVFERRRVNNMEWSVLTYRQLPNLHSRVGAEAILTTTLKAKAWGPAPSPSRLLRFFGKSVKSMVRTKYGPYDAMDLQPDRVREALIDEQMMQHTDSKWTPWIDAHAPLLDRRFAVTLQQQVHSKRGGSQGKAALAEELERQMKERRESAEKRTAMRRRILDFQSGYAAGKSMDASLRAHDVEKYEQTRRNSLVASGIPKVASETLQAKLSRLRKSRAVSGLHGV